MNGYPFVINLYAMLLSGAVFTGLAFALLLWLIKGPEQKANLFLGLALVVLCTSLLPLGPLQFSLALGPLLYFYVRQLATPDRQTSHKDLLHFVPALIAFILAIAGLNINPAFSCCAVVIYVYLSHRRIIRFYDHQKFQEGDRFRAQLKSVQVSLAGLGILTILSLAYFLINALFYRDQLTSAPYDFLLAAMLIRMAALAIIKPVIVPVTLIAPDTLKRSDLQRKSAWLKRAMQTGQYHLDPELTLNTLAEKLLLTTHELSRIINQGLKKSFNDFINGYRVAEVTQKMQDPAFGHVNLTGIAYACGFNSKSTFHRIFKQMTGKSPAEYKAEQPKELPSYKLRPQRPGLALTLRHPNRRFMFRNFLKIAFRNFRSNKLSTLINVVSLSVGTTAALVIYLIIHFDFSFDRFHKDRDRIYRVVTTFSSAGQQSYNAGLPGAAIELTKDQLSQINASARLFTLYQPHVTIPTGQTATDLKAQDNVILTDGGYFRLFTYHWLAGNAGQALSRPNQVVLTALQAKKYFPSLKYGDMLGRTVQYDSLRTTVSGVVADITGNTDLTFHDFISFPTVAVTPALKAQVLVNAFQSITPEQQFFVRLPEGSSAEKVSLQLNQLYKSHYPPAAGQNSQQSFYFQPLNDLHFNANYGTYGNGRTANKTTLYELGAIALFLLLMGCINFINLSTAASVKRAKEIGIRKTMGSRRSQLIAQFIIETFFLTLITVILSAALTPLLLQAFANFIPAGINASLLLQPGVLLFLLLLAIIVALAAGFYPAMILSAFNPVSVLRSQVQSGGQTRSTTLRKSLTVAQFVIAQFFIMATLLVSKQIYYALHKDLGFKKEAILIVNSPWKDRQNSKVKLFLDKLSAMPQVEQVSAGRDAPMSNDPHSASATYRDGKNEIRVDKIGEKFGDQNYIKVYHIPLLAGRNLQPQDTVNTVLINQNLARSLGFKDPDEAIGKSLAGFLGKPQTQIVGVVADFHQESIHAPIIPLVILTSTNLYFNGTFHIALKPGNWQSAISQIQAAYKDVYPGEDFSFQFFDESIAQLYTSEQNTAKLLNWATGFTILISCLGLLGLTIYTANQRQKEIGIRKVMGASVAQMVVLLSSELSWLIVLAFVIATPLAWLAMQQWMQSFADRTSLSWWVFIGSGAGMFLLAILTSATQTVKAALTNPVKSIRNQ
ncbi:FtsX-like permease family protein [Mucilaginibacter pineti]|nr:FtsX-like permease family protein [Mucilaginibacter pineti]